VPASSITIATFNLLNYLAPPNAFYQFDNIYTEQEWQGKQQWTEATLNKVAADIVAFQEVFSPDELAALCKRCGYAYFKVIDIPVIDSRYIYSRPMVALASRWPIIHGQPLAVKKTKSISSAFAFSRRPLHAQIQLPHFGLTDFYVVHLKSQRATEESEDSPYPEHNQRVYGQWRSSYQRHDEAMVLKTLMRANKCQTHRPAVVLGDFNQRLTSESLQALVDMPPQPHQQQDRAKLFLQDSWALLQSQGIRPASHYWGEHGSVLDYILLSQEFIGSVTLHHTQDCHLVSPIFARDRYASDHGVVSITLRRP